jgi:hypothetical protein
MDIALKNLISKVKNLSRGVDNLSVWDIDDTLFVSPKTNVYVTKNGSIVRKLTTEQFNGYKLKPGEQFDFFEFKDADLFFRTAKPLTGNLKTAKIALQSRNTMVLILTARSDFNNKDLFLKKFEMYGLDMSKPNIHVVRSGNLGMSTVEGKRAVLAEVLKAHQFKTASMYDDDMRNLDAFLDIPTEKTSKSAFIAKRGRLFPY